jgi:hypothetical protein
MKKVSAARHLVAELRYHLIQTVRRLSYFSRNIEIRPVPPIGQMAKEIFKAKVAALLLAFF